MNKLKRSMALDIGDARIGVALSDPLGLTAQPHSTISRNIGDKQVFQKLAELIDQMEVMEIIIGLPITLQGEEGEQAEKVRTFVKRWEQKLKQTDKNKDIPIHFWDERMSTAQAERIVVGSRLKNNEKSAALDRVAAAIILDSYLLMKGTQRASF